MALLRNLELYFGIFNASNQNMTVDITFYDTATGTKVGSTIPFADLRPGEVRQVSDVWASAATSACGPPWRWWKPSPTTSSPRRSGMHMRYLPPPAGKALKFAAETIDLPRLCARDVALHTVSVAVVGVGGLGGVALVAGEPVVLAVRSHEAAVDADVRGIRGRHELALLLDRGAKPVQLLVERNPHHPNRPVT